MTSKIKAHKFVSPAGVSTNSTSAAKLVRGATLSFNRMGASVEGIGKILEDINKNNRSAKILEENNEEIRRRQARLEADRLAEERQEGKTKSSSEMEREGKAEEARDPKLKKKRKGFMSFLDGLLQPFVGFFGNLLAIGIGAATLDWLSDENNQKMISEFMKKFTFVVKKVWGFIKAAVDNIGDGFSKLVDPESGFLDRIGGFGQMMLGIIGLKYLMNPFSLVTDLLSVLDLFNNYDPSRTRSGDDGKNNSRRKRGDTTGSTNRVDDGGLDKDGKPKPRSGPVDNPRQSGVNKFSKLHGNEAARAWSGAYDDAVRDGLSPSQATQRANTKTNRLLNNGRLSSAPKTGSLAPTTQVRGSTLTKGVGDTFGKFRLDKLSKRFILKFLGKGGYKGVMALIKKIRIPFFSTFITAVFNWIAGDSVMEAASKGLGAGLGEVLGGWAGGAIGAFGGPAAPITVPLGAFVGSMLGAIAGEAIGGWIYRTMTGKAGEGEGLGALGKAALEGAKKLWTDFIANGEFWAGLWESIKNLGGQIMDGAWNAITSMWNFAKGQVLDFGKMLMEASKPWREAVWAAFQKYVLNGPQELLNLIFDTILAGAQGIGKVFKEGAPILLQMIQEAGKAAINWVFEKIRGIFTGWNLGNIAGKIGELFQLIGMPATLIPEMLTAVGNKVSKTVAEGFAKAKEIGEMIIDPIKGYIDPAVRAIQETWKIATGIPGFVYDNAIKPIFSAVGEIWNSGGKIWEWLNKENTFQDLTGAEPIDVSASIQQLSGGGKVALYAGHADMTKPGPDTAYGTSGGGISGNMSTAPHMPYAKGYQSNEAYFNDKIAQKAAALSGGLAMYRKPVRVDYTSNPQSNYSRIDKDNAAGITTVELHMDAPTPMGRSGMMGINPNMAARGKENGFINALNAAYGIHSAQRKLGAVNSNNLSGLLEVAPLNQSILDGPQAFINREASKIANAIKAGAKGNIPVVTGEGDTTVTPSDSSSPALQTTSPGAPPPPPPPPPPKKFFESLPGMLKDFANTLAGGKPGEDILNIGDLNLSFDEKGNQIIPEGAEETTPKVNFMDAAKSGFADDLKLQTIGKYDFSKTYAMDLNFHSSETIPFVIEMPVPITTPVIINRDMSNIFVSESPLLEQ